MANLLYITCNVRHQDRSCTLSLGNEFLEEYIRRNPQDQVQVLDLYRDSIQRVDQDVLDAWGWIERGEDYLVHLSDEERHKIARFWRLADQLEQCDKYVFVTHSLNLWFPAEFKIYIDAILVPGRTYSLTPHLAKGMLRPVRRKSLHLHAGQPYRFGQEQDLSIAYLRSVLNFLGITDQETVFLEDDDPERVSMMEHKKARHRLLELAHSF